MEQKDILFCLAYDLLQNERLVIKKLAQLANINIDQELNTYTEEKCALINHVFLGINDPMCIKITQKQYKPIIIPESITVSAGGYFINLLDIVSYINKNRDSLVAHLQQNFKSVLPSFLKTHPHISEKLENAMDILQIATMQSLVFLRTRGLQVLFTTQMIKYLHETYSLSAQISLETLTTTEIYTQYLPIAQAAIFAITYGIPLYKNIRDTEQISKSIIADLHNPEMTHSQAILLNVFRTITDGFYEVMPSPIETSSKIYNWISLVLSLLPKKINKTGELIAEISKKFSETQNKNILFNLEFMNKPENNNYTEFIINEINNYINKNKKIILPVFEPVSNLDKLTNIICQRTFSDLITNYKLINISQTNITPVLRKNITALVKEPTLSTIKIQL